MNTKQQGALGVSKAITFFMENGFIVSLPIGDLPRYDLIVDIDGSLKRVEVKTCGLSKSPELSYEVMLRTTSGNRTSTKSTLLSSDDCDFVFIATGDGNQYLFPIIMLEGRSTISLPGKYEQFAVK